MNRMQKRRLTKAMQRFRKKQADKLCRAEQALMQALFQGGATQPQEQERRTLQ
jgi:hypothetical protein